jgi:hypothetical protein
LGEFIIRDYAMIVYAYKNYYKYSNIPMPHTLNPFLFRAYPSFQDLSAGNPNCVQLPASICY